MFMFLGSCAVKHTPLPVTKLTHRVALEMKKHTGYWIEVQIPQRKLILARGDHIIRTYPVAVGMPSYPTPVGERLINRIVWNPWWHPPKTSDWVDDPTPVPPRSSANPLGEIKMPLGKGYLIHGTKAIRSIGRWASHGCIRMLFEDVFGLTQLLLTEYSDTSAIEMMEKANRNPAKEFTSKLEIEIPVILTYETVRVHNGHIMISPDIYRKDENRIARIQQEIAPYLKRDEMASRKKIKRFLRMFRHQTIHIPLNSLVE
jgi:murein L,D-transpeptidase YcbB/YkuD